MAKASNLEKLSGNLDLSMVAFDFSRLVKYYPHYEVRIRDCALARVFECLARSGEVRGKCIKLDDELYKVEPVLSLPKRSFGVLITSIVPRPSITETAQLNGLGLISTVSVELPRKLHRLASTIISVLRDTFVDQYNVLESAFSACFVSAERKLMDGFEAILGAAFRRSHAEALLPITLMTVTRLNSNRYRYHLGRDQACKLLEKLKLVRASPFSPLESVFALLFDRSLDTFIRENALSNDEFKVLPMQKIIELEGNKKTNLVQAQIFGTTLANLEACRIRNYSLQINCQPRHTEQILRAILQFRPDFEEQLRFNLEGYSEFWDRLAEEWRDSAPLRQNISAGLKLFLLQLDQEAIIEIIKKIFLEP